jgi:hypothetical protein
MMKIEVGPVSQSFLDIFGNKACSDCGTLWQAAAGPHGALPRTENVALHKGIPSSAQGNQALERRSVRMKSYSNVFSG